MGRGREGVQGRQGVENGAAGCLGAVEQMSYMHCIPDCTALHSDFTATQWPDKKQGYSSAAQTH